MNIEERIEIIKRNTRCSDAVHIRNTREVSSAIEWLLENAQHSEWHYWSQGIFVFTNPSRAIEVKLKFGIE